MRMLNFTAVDFETATTNRKICEIGLVVVRDGVIVDRFQSYVQPPGNKYDNMCMAKHHITPDITVNSPTFAELWPKIEKYFVNTTIIAHNKSFDEDALMKNLDYYGIATMGIQPFLCTCDYYKKTGLEALCHGFGMEYDPTKHHSALFDAECCATFAIHMFNGDEPDWDIINKFKKQTKTSVKIKREKSISGDLLVKDLSGADPNNPFYDRKVVITGTFTQDRKWIAKTIKSMGADIDSSITKKTNFVLKGESPGPEKMNKLEKLIHDGFNIKVIEQFDLNQILSGIWEPYCGDKIIVKDLDFTVAHFEKKHLSFKNDYNIIASKEMFVGEGLAGERKYFNTITGNLGSFDSPYLCEETQICVLSDSTIDKLYKGFKDETILLIQDFYNKNKSIVFDFKFLTESDILDFCKRRCEKCGDQLTMGYYEMYMESAISNLEKSVTPEIQFRDGKNYVKINGKYVLKVEDGRTWCPSRQFRGDTYSIKEDKGRSDDE